MSEYGADPSSPTRSESRAELETSRIMILRKESHRPSLQERTSHCLKTVVLSNAYATLYAIVIFLNLVLIVWLMVLAGKIPTSPWFSAIDAITILALLFELSVGIVTKGKNYFTELSTWFDVVVCVLSVSTLISLHTLDHKFQTSLGLALFMMVARYTTSLLRLITLLRRSRQMNADEVEMVDLDKIIATTSPRRELPHLGSSPRLHLNDENKITLRHDNFNSHDLRRGERESISSNSSNSTGSDRRQHVSEIV